MGDRCDIQHRSRSQRNPSGVGFYLDPSFMYRDSAARHSGNILAMYSPTFATAQGRCKEKRELSHSGKAAPLVSTLEDLAFRLDETSAATLAAAFHENCETRFLVHGAR